MNAPIFVTNGRFFITQRLSHAIEEEADDTY